VPRSSKVLSLTKLPFAWCFNLYRVLLLHVSYRSAGLARTKSSNIVRVNTWHLRKREHSADTPHFQLPGLIRKLDVKQTGFELPAAVWSCVIGRVLSYVSSLLPFQS